MEYCPLCYDRLETRECAPCHDCGGDVPTEIDHFQQGKHTYTSYRVFADLKLTLCNFCTVDFGSYRREYFGFQHGERIHFERFTYIRRLDDPRLERDKFCPTCHCRLKFLKFVQAIRETNQANPS